MTTQAQAPAVADILGTLLDLRDREREIAGRLSRLSRQVATRAFGARPARGLAH